MLSGWALWQDPGFLEAYAEGHGWTVDEVDGIRLLVSSKRFWSKRSTVNADSVSDPHGIWMKYPNTVIKTYTPISGLTSEAWNRGTYLLNLEGDYLGGFSKHCRAHIKKSQASGQEVQGAENKDQLREWFSLYERTGAQMKFKTHKWKAVRTLFDSPYGKLITSHFGGEITGGLFLLLGKDVAIEWIGAIDRRFTDLYPNSLLHLNAFTSLLGKVKVYDLGGVILGTGIDQFKRGFGGEYAPLYVYRRQDQ